MCRSHKRATAANVVEGGMRHDTKKSMQAAAVFERQTICKCKKLCPTNIDAVRQREIFDTYYDELDWSQKTLFIRSCVKTSPIAEKRSMYPILTNKSRHFNCIYNFIDHNGISIEVCRDFFLKCLQIKPTRLYRALSTSLKNPTAIDQRGRQPSKNKTTQERRDDVMHFIDQIPAYESHYGRKQTERKYLCHTLNMKTLYGEYVRVMQLREKKPVKENIFRTIYHTEYNLSFKKRHTDNCKICDELNAQFNSTVTLPAQKIRLEEEKANHLLLVEQRNCLFRSDIEAAMESNDRTAVLTFDFQKTLETPSISTSISFDKRQLWTYNLCIYDEIVRKGNRALCLFLSFSLISCHFVFPTNWFFIEWSVFIILKVTCTYGVKMLRLVVHKKWAPVY